MTPDRQSLDCSGQYCTPIEKDVLHFSKSTEADFTYNSNHLFSTPILR